MTRFCLGLVIDTSPAPVFLVSSCAFKQFYMNTRPYTPEETVHHFIVTLSRDEPLIYSVANPNPQEIFDQLNAAAQKRHNISGFNFTQDEQIKDQYYVTLIDEESSESTRIKIGSLVQLKSGGPTMTAGRLNSRQTEIVCHWFSADGTYNEQSFKNALLRLAGQ